MAKRKVYYNSFADEVVYGMIREVVPADMELVTLDADDDAERIRKIADADVVVVAATPLTGPMIAAAKKLQIICHQGVGYHDTVDTAAVKARGIPLVLTPEGTTTPVAEMTILMILAVFRRLTYADPELRQGRWHVNALRPVSHNLNGKQVGFVGMGRIGQATARLVQAFGARSVYYDAFPTLTPEQAAAIGTRAVSFDEVIETSDVVSLHIPPSPQAKHMMNAETIGRMKRGAVLINTARGPLVDEAALVAALKSGHLGGAGLDVYDPEPPKPGHPLFALPNVVVTPHIAGGTRSAFQEKMGAIFENVRRFYAKEPLNHPVSL